MKKLLVVIMLAVGLSGCYTVLSKIRIVDIQQGNMISPEMIKQLHPGMTKAQVRDVVGDPLLNDTFEANRWDYVYTMDKPHKPLAKQQFTLYFDKNGRLVRYGNSE